MAENSTGERRLASGHEELRPDIWIRAGMTPEPCHLCGARAIYAYVDMIVCRKCGSEIQSMLNRLRGR